MAPTKGDINETCRNDSLAYINALNSVSFRITAKFKYIRVSIWMLNITVQYIFMHLLEVLRFSSKYPRKKVRNRNALIGCLKSLCLFEKCVKQYL